MDKTVIIERVRKAIPAGIARKLWVKSAGRCEYRNCNMLLWRDSLMQADLNKSYISHIIAAKEDGPRGDSKLSTKLETDFDNLLLLCDECHRRIDKGAPGENTVALLKEMKAEHENRIEIVTSIKPERKSHIVIYKANVGLHTPSLAFDSLRNYLLPEWHPASANAFDLSLSNSLQRDRDAGFWAAELENLETQFNEQLRPRLRKGDIGHLSLFAFAPMPLLVKLGVLLNDISHAEIYQPIRSPKGWKLGNTDTGFNYTVIEPATHHPAVALNISLSAAISNERITSVMGDEVSIYTITIDKPFNDYLQQKQQLQAFGETVRKLLNTIKSKYSAQTPLNIFPAMPVATAIELGRSWMPKADMPLMIYDENTAAGGFIKAVNIKNE